MLTSHGSEYGIKRPPAECEHWHGTKRRSFRIPEEAVTSLPSYEIEQGLVGLPRINVEPLHPAVVKAMAKNRK